MAKVIRGCLCGWGSGAWQPAVYAWMVAGDGTIDTPWSCPLHSVSLNTDKNSIRLIVTSCFPAGCPFCMPLDNETVIGVARLPAVRSCRRNVSGLSAANCSRTDCAAALAGEANVMSIRMRDEVLGFHRRTANNLWKNGQLGTLLPSGATPSYNEHWCGRLG